MKNLISLILASVILIFFASSWFGRYQPVSLDLHAPTTITCEIKGEVKRPGVYTVANGSTLQMLIEQAGGTNPEADLSALSLKEPLDANALIVIPVQPEKPRISINSAGEEDLCTLPGIGPALAGRIVDYRREQSFSSLEQLMEVKGIGPKMFEAIRELICL